MRPTPESMWALATKPGVAGSLGLATMPEPPEAEGPVLVRSLAVGLCGTDLEIVEGLTGRAPDDAELLVIGHESLGRVIRSTAPGLGPGDLVVPFVRRPDPVPCAACAEGEWDMCRNGRYTSHGITGRHGFARERWRSVPAALVRVDERLTGTGVLVEPASVLAKAWEQIDHIGRRGFAAPRIAAITGAGPVGLLAAYLAVRRGLEVHVFDRVTSGPKPAIVSALGAHYHTGSLPGSGVAADIMVECTGAPEVILDVLESGGRATVTCLLGMSPGREITPIDLAALNARLVRQNGVVFGSVNANRRHYEKAVSELLTADPDWLASLISREVPFSDFEDAFQRRPDDVKVVLRSWSGAGPA